MKGKNEASNVNEARVKTITEKRRILEENSTEIRQRVEKCFEKLSMSLKIRERQLLRQIEAVHNQQLSIIQSNWDLLPSVPPINVNLDYCGNLEETIFKFGRIELPDKDGIVVKDAEPYRVEEYVEANKDHVSFDKSIKIDENIIINLDEQIDSSTTEKNTEIDNSKHNYNNNCSILCSSVLESSLNASFDSECNVRLENSDNFCSDDGNELTVVEAPIDSGKLTNLEDNEKIEEIDDKNVESPGANGNDEHPKQIQQWLQQILVETETEPVVHETEQFLEISKCRYREFEFPLKT